MSDTPQSGRFAALEARLPAHLATGQLWMLKGQVTGPITFTTAVKDQAGRAVFYDETIRVPLAMRGPGLPAGRILREQVRSIDVASTVLELARHGFSYLLNRRYQFPFSIQN